MNSREKKLATVKLAQCFIKNGKVLNKSEYKKLQIQPIRGSTFRTIWGSYEIAAKRAMATSEWQEFISKPEVAPKPKAKPASAAKKVTKNG